MIRKRENPDSFKAGLLALAVHAALLAAMLVSFNWKAAHPVMNVTEVELWDKLPAQKSIETPKPEPVVKEEPKPEPKEEPKPIIKEEPKPEPKPEEPKVDIELEKKKKEEVLKKEKELAEKLEQDKKLKALQAETREDELKEKQALKEKKAAEKAQKDALKKLQQEALSEEKGNDDKAASAANASLIGEYTEKIKAKIRGNVNKTLCGDGNPELRFEINVLPTGQLSGSPRLIKSSENPACDEAVERAIIASEPLPLPDDASLKAQFKNLKLKFRPND
jgi:colicin import membrane protein